MSNPIIHATFDGQVFRPDEPVTLPPNTRVTITVPSVDQASGEEEEASFLKCAPLLNLQGPPDWSRNWEEYLHHGRKFPDE